MPMACTIVPGRVVPLRLGIGSLSSYGHARPSTRRWLTFTYFLNFLNVRTLSTKLAA